MPDAFPNALPTHACHVAYLLKVVTAKILVNLMKNCFDKLLLCGRDDVQTLGFSKTAGSRMSSPRHAPEEHAHNLDDWPIHQGRTGRTCSWSVVLNRSGKCRVFPMRHSRCSVVLNHGSQCRMCPVRHVRCWNVKLNHGKKCCMYGSELNHFWSLCERHMTKRNSFHSVACWWVHVKEIQFTDCLLSGHTGESIIITQYLFEAISMHWRRSHILQIVIRRNHTTMLQVRCWFVYGHSHLWTLVLDLKVAILSIGTQRCWRGCCNRCSWIVRSVT